MEKLFIRRRLLMTLGTKSHARKQVFLCIRVYRFVNPRAILIEISRYIRESPVQQATINLRTYKGERYLLQLGTVRNIQLFIPIAIAINDRDRIYSHKSDLLFILDQLLVDMIRIN